MICFTSPYIQVDIARLQECVATPYDDPNWENVCILPPEDRSNIERKGVSRAKDRSTMATTLDVIFVGSMYLNSVDRCGVTVKVFDNCLSLICINELEGLGSLYVNL